jgi:hypothetical protein
MEQHNTDSSGNHSSDDDFIDDHLSSAAASSASARCSDGAVEYPQISVTDEMGEVSYRMSNDHQQQSMEEDDQTLSFPRDPIGKTGPYPATSTSQSRQQAYFQSDLFHATYPPGGCGSSSIVHGESTCMEKTPSGSLKVPLSDECDGLDHRAILAILQQIISMKVPELHVANQEQQVVRPEESLLVEQRGPEDHDPVRVELKIQQEPGDHRSLKIKHLGGDHLEYDLFCQRLIQGILS